MRVAGTVQEAPVAIDDGYRSDVDAVYRMAARDRRERGVPGAETASG